jgi:kynurenine formamidase
LLRTGFGKFYPDRKKYLGTDERGAAAVAKLHFPGLDPQAARWLTQSRSIKAIGLDTASIDRGQSTLFESHRNLFEKNIPAFENVANLDQLPVKGFTVVAPPNLLQGPDTDAPYLDSYLKSITGPIVRSHNALVRVIEQLPARLEPLAP